MKQLQIIILSLLFSCCGVDNHCGDEYPKNIYTWKCQCEGYIYETYDIFNACTTVTDSTWLEPID